MSAFSLDQCIVKVIASPHYEYPNVLKHVVVKGFHPSDGEVAFLEALQIDRRHCDEMHFFEILDEEGFELSQFARTLFEDLDEGFGYLRSDFVNHPYRKGTGVWGRELNRGMMIYVQSVHVYEQCHQGKGIPSFMLQKLAESEYAPPGSFLFAQPVPEEELDEERRAACVALFRKNGYRRVGRTCYMAYAKDLSHASHSLPAVDDVEEHCNRPIMLVHDIISFGPLGRPAPDVEQAIRLAYTQDPTFLQAKNENGATPLQLAVHCENLPAVRALLALPPESGILTELTACDPQGRNPEERCEFAMSLKRQQMERSTGTWPGRTCTDAGVRILYLVKRARGELAGVSEDDFVRGRQWGCTCGQCAGRWLSPRMRYRLLDTAQRSVDAMRTTIRAWTEGPLPDDAPGIGFIPEDIRAAGLTRSFYEAYEMLVHATAAVLQQPGDGGLPLPALVHSAVGDLANEFLLRRGRVEHALDFVTYTARLESPAPRGNGSWDERQARLAEQGDQQAVAYAGMVSCENDLDFPRVAERARLPDELKYHTHGVVHQPGWSIVDMLTEMGVIHDVWGSEVQLSGRAVPFFHADCFAEHVLDLVVFYAKEYSLLGDGSWDKERERERHEAKGAQTMYFALPECAKGLDFARVVDMLDLPYNHYN